MTTDDERIAYLASGEGTLDDLEQSDLDALRDVLADPALWVEAAPGLEQAVVAAIAAEAAASTAGGTAVASSGSAAAVGPAGSSSSAASRAPSAARARWLRPGALVGAAAAAAVLVVVVLLSPDGSGPSEPLAAVLDPTELVPDAQGRATFTKTDSGWRVELDATGLPRLDGGRFYQAWLLSSDGVLVAIGSFNEGADVVLWAGVSPVDFPTITITEEAADGNAESSGRRVLAGPITAD
jgi:hypothetical protein